jgi:hypothetical protein
MKTLTVHERINFKSHYPPIGFMRIKRVAHYGHYAETNSNHKSFEIPFWQELQRDFTWFNVFKNKF